MHSSKRGLCIIISIENFTPKSNFNQRTGANIDLDMLHRVFIKLGFDVQQHQDVTAVSACQVLAEGL